MQTLKKSTRKVLEKEVHHFWHIVCIWNVHSNSNAMKKFIYLFSLLGLFFAMTSSSVVSYPEITNSAFQAGEKLRYRVTYGFIDAGEAIIEVKSTDVKKNGRALHHVKGVGKTLGGFSAFYNVHDTYESYIDQKSMMPWIFKRHVNEGGYKINQRYDFNQKNSSVSNGETDYTVSMGIQDMISSFYKARTLNFKDMKVGKEFSFECFMDNEIFTLKIKYMGEEEIKIRKGKFNCYKFVPVVQTGRYFESEDDVQFWVTADKNRIPVLIKAKIPVGTVKMHLVEWNGLKNELSSKVK